MMIITPDTWPYGPNSPWCLLSGNRCLYIHDGSTGYNLMKVGVPMVKVTLRDWAVLMRTHTGPGGEVLFFDPSKVTANLPADWDG